MRKLFVLLTTIVLVSGCAPKPSIPTHKYNGASDYFAELMNKNITEASTFSDNESFDDDMFYHEPEEYDKIDYEYSDISELIRIDLNANQSSPNDFFLLLGEKFKMNFIVSPEINQPITMYLKNASLRTIAKACFQHLGLIFEKIDNGYMIKPQRIITRCYKLPLMREARKISTATRTTPSQGNQNSGDNSSSISSEHSGDLWQSIINVALEIIRRHSYASVSGANKAGSVSTKDASVIPVKDTSMLIVTASEDAIQEIDKFIDSIRKFLSVQICIEARIYDIEYDRSTQAGIDWSKLRLYLGDKIGNDIRSQSIGGNKYEFDGAGTLILNRTASSPQGVFNAIFSFLRTVGNARVVASPKISIINGNSAILKVGETKQIFGGVQSVPSAQGNFGYTQAVNNVQFSPIFTGLTLYVSAMMTNNVITLHIKPSYTSDIEKSMSVNIDGKGSTFPITSILSKDTDTIVQVPNGGFILMSSLERSAETKNFRSGTRVDKSSDSQLVMVLHAQPVNRRSSSAETMRNINNTFFERGHINPSGHIKHSPNNIHQKKLIEPHHQNPTDSSPIQKTSGTTQKKKVIQTKATKQHQPKHNDVLIRRKHKTDNTGPLNSKSKVHPVISMEKKNNKPIETLGGA